MKDPLCFDSSKCSKLKLEHCKITMAAGFKCKYYDVGLICGAFNFLLPWEDEAF